jgi:hypothetical protein
MTWVRVIVGMLMCWAHSAAAATLAWNANTESDLAGYRVYHCNLTPCAPASGNQSLLITLGKVTNFDIGTPTIIQYYYVTAFDTSNAESSGSNVVSFIPGSLTTAGTSPIANVTLTVVGIPSLGKWGVEAFTTDMRDVKATVYLDGKMYLTDSTSPYSFPASAGFTTTGTFGAGTHKVEFVFYLEGTATEIGRANVTVQEGTSTTSSSTVTLTVVGSPAAGQWGVVGSTTDTRNVKATIYLDGIEYKTDHAGVYSFPSSNGIVPQTGSFGSGAHTVAFIFYLEGTDTEIGRSSITVREGA